MSMKDEYEGTHSEEDLKRIGAVLLGAAPIAPTMMHKAPPFHGKPGTPAGTRYNLGASAQEQSVFARGIDGHDKQMVRHNWV